MTRILSRVSKLRILDPACGSGSFLIGAYQYLLDWHLQFCTANDPAKWAKGGKPALVQGSGGGWKLTIAERKRILLNNIYGVDIDSQAVETTKLSLLLKVLEGETGQTIEPLFRIFHERALPDLGDNIKCGNSLIGPDFYQQTELPLLTDDEKYRINVFDWHKEFPDIFRRRSSSSELRETAAASPLDYGMPGVPLHGSYSQKKKKGETAAPSSTPVESEWEGGFDAVIGNPPYVRIQTSDKADLAYFSRNYETAVGNFDIYCLFAERGVTLLRSKGLLGFIVAHRFYKTDYGEGLRQFLSKRHLLKQTVDFDGFMVFKDASINTCLLLLENAPNKEFFFAKARFSKMQAAEVAQRLRALDQVRQTTHEFESGYLAAAKFTSAPWVFVWPQEETVWEKLTEIPRTLGDVTTHIFQGIKTGADAYYVGERVGEGRESALVKFEQEAAPVELEKELLKPLIKGGEMQRYVVGHSAKQILFPYSEGRLLAQTELAKKYPRTWAYFCRHKGFLANREDGKMKGTDWYGYTRNQALNTMFLPKIITPDYYAHASYCLDSKGNFFFCGGGAGGYGIVARGGIDLRFLLGLLNCKLLDWFLQKISLRAYQTAYMYVKKYIEQLPIRVINFSDKSDKAAHDRMVKLVEQMLELHKQLAAARTPQEKTALERQITATDTQIDRLVYDLYGLTEEEIKIVEEAAA